MMMGEGHKLKWPDVGGDQKEQGFPSFVSRGTIKVTSFLTLVAALLNGRCNFFLPLFTTDVTQYNLKFLFIYSG